MSAIIDRAYIENLSHVPAEKLMGVTAMKFYSALNATYGENVTSAASRALLQQPDAAFSGVKAFKDRIITALLDDKEISVEDQKYIEGYVHRISLASLCNSKKQ